MSVAASAAFRRCTIVVLLTGAAWRARGGGVRAADRSRRNVRLLQEVEGKARAAYKASYRQQVRETYGYCPRVNGIAKVLRETSTMSRDIPSSREKVEQVAVKDVPKG